MMDPTSKVAFDQILTKEKEACTPEDLAFLKARSSYLTQEQIEKYGLADSVPEGEEKPKKAK